MALPNKTWDATYCTDATDANLFADVMIDILTAIADVVDVDMSSSAQTVSTSFASFDTSEQTFNAMAAIGEADTNGIVIKDTANDVQWRIGADGSAVNKLKVELWDDTAEEYTTYCTITDNDIYNGDGNPITYLTDIAGGTAITVTDSDGAFTVAVTSGGVDTDQIAAGAVTNAKVSATANISGSKLLNESITAAKITAGQSERVMISNGVYAAWGQIPTAGISDSAVNTAKLLDESVTAAKIANATIDYTKLAPTGGVIGEQMMATKLGAVTFDDVPVGTEIGDFVRVTGGTGSVFYNIDGWGGYYMPYPTDFQEGDTYPETGNDSKFTCTNGGVYYVSVLLEVTGGGGAFLQSYLTGLALVVNSTTYYGRRFSGAFGAGSDYSAGFGYITKVQLATSSLINLSSGDTVEWVFWAPKSNCSVSGSTGRVHAEAIRVY